MVINVLFSFTRKLFTYYRLACKWNTQTHTHTRRFFTVRFIYFRVIKKWKIVKDESILMLSSILCWLLYVKIHKIIFCFDISALGTIFCCVERLLCATEILSYQRQRRKECGECEKMWCLWKRNRRTEQWS
jgi:hypothetical protein